MGQKNVTLSVDEELLSDVRILAARQGLSVSALLRKQLRAVVGAERTRKRALAGIEDLLTSPQLVIGEALPDRDTLHER